MTHFVKRREVLGLEADQIFGRVGPGRDRVGGSGIVDAGEEYSPDRDAAVIDRLKDAWGACAAVKKQEA
jgi:hypothetical protein